jgi:UDP-glucuronate 4-epimerase
MSVLVTGAAAFIGFHLCQRLLERGTPVLGFDNLNPYYDPALKRARFALLRGQIPDGQALPPGLPRRLMNLAAQAGVR